MKKEKKIQKPKFKESLCGLDFIRSRPEEERKGICAELRVMAVAMTQPKLSYEEIIALPLDVFFLYLAEYRDKYKKTYEKIATQRLKPEEETSGFQFVKEEDYIKIAEGSNKGEIEFSKVK